MGFSAGCRKVSGKQRLGECVLPWPRSRCVAGCGRGQGRFPVPAKLLEREWAGLAKWPSVSMCSMTVTSIRAGSPSRAENSPACAGGCGSVLSRGERPADGGRSRSGTLVGRPSGSRQPHGVCDPAARLASRRGTGAVMSSWVASVRRGGRAVVVVLVAIMLSFGVLASPANPQTPPRHGSFERVDALRFWGRRTGAAVSRHRSRGRVRTSARGMGGGPAASPRGQDRPADVGP
jgi:hypothetical protein